MIENPKVGERVSYEDVANPRKYGEIVDIVGSAWGVQYAISWEGTDGTILDYSDLRQAGWRREPAIVRCAWGTGDCGSAADVRTTTYAEDGTPATTHSTNRPLCFAHVALDVRAIPEGWTVTVSTGAQQAVTA